MYRLPDKNGTALILPVTDVPSCDPSYGWVADFILAEALQERLDRLTAERTAIDKILISKSEFLRRLRPSHDDLRRRVADRVRSYLVDPTLRHFQNLDPLSHFETRFSPRQMVTESVFVPDWADIKGAVEGLPDDGIDDVSRAKMCKKVDAQILEVRSQIPLVSRECRRFVEFWREVQTQLREPAGPRALHLDASPEPERRAWGTLGLDKYLNPDGLLPNPPD